MIIPKGFPPKKCASDLCRETTFENNQFKNYNSYLIKVFKGNIGNRNYA